MSLFLVNAVLWPALILVAVPWLLHMFARSRPPVYRFSSVEFILKIVKSTMRIRKPRDWLVLGLRTLLFAAVILMFLRPLFFARQRLAGYRQRKNLILLVDATASMAYTDGGQSRFAAACAEAAEVLSGLSSRDQANIIWIKAAPEAVFPEPGSNISYLRETLRRATVGYEAGDIRGALKLAADMLADQEEGRREICVISDFQKSAWAEVELDTGAGIDLIKVKVGQGDGANAALAGITLDPDAPLAGEETAIFCEVRNYAPVPARRTVFLGIDESRQSQEVFLPAWGRAVAGFRYTFRNPGIVRLHAELDEDSFAGDDQITVLAAAAAGVQVAVVGADTPTGLAWLRVLAAVDWIKPVEITAADLQKELPHDIIMLAEWDGTGAAGLHEFLASGRSAVWAPAAGLNSSALAAALGLPAPASPGSLAAQEETDKPYRIRISAVDDQVFSIFRDGAYGEPLSASIRKRLRLNLESFPEREDLAVYEDAIPALSRFRSNGLLFLWNLNLDERHSDLSGRVEFLPFLAELLLSCRGRSRGFDYRHPGENIIWQLPHDVPATDVILTDPRGEEIPASVSTVAADTVFKSGKVYEPGVYTWKLQGTAMAYSVVNFPVIEMDLRSMAPEEIKATGAVTVTGGSRVRSLRDGINLWPHLLVLAGILLILELLVLNWAEKN